LLMKCLMLAQWLKPFVPLVVVMFCEDHAMSAAIKHL